MVMGNETKEISMSNESAKRNYADMSVEEVIKTVIRDGKMQGTVTIPLRRDGYHSCCNVMFVEEV